MKAISIRELHAKTGYWVRRSVTLGPITVADNGNVVAQIVPVQASAATNLFAARKQRMGYVRLLGKLKGGADSTQSVSEDRNAQ